MDANDGRREPSAPPGPSATEPSSDPSSEPSTEPSTDTSGARVHRTLDRALDRALHRTALPLRGIRILGGVTWAFGIYVAAAFPLLLFVLGDHYWFLRDDWYFITERELSSPGDLFRDHNGHWSTGPIVVFRALYALPVGLRSYVPYQAAVVTAHLAVVVLLRALMRRYRVGPWTATVVAGAAVLFGTGREDIIWAFQVGYTDPSPSPSRTGCSPTTRAPSADATRRRGGRGGRGGLGQPADTHLRGPGGHAAPPAGLAGDRPEPGPRGGRLPALVGIAHPDRSSPWGRPPVDTGRSTGSPTDTPRRPLSPAPVAPVAAVALALVLVVGGILAVGWGPTRRRGHRWWAALGHGGPGQGRRCGRAGHLVRCHRRVHRPGGPGPLDLRKPGRRRQPLRLRVRRAHAADGGAGGQRLPAALALLRCRGARAAGARDAANATSFHISPFGPGYHAHQEALIRNAVRSPYARWAPDRLRPDPDVFNSQGLTMGFLRGAVGAGKLRLPTGPIPGPIAGELAIRLGLDQQPATAPLELCEPTPADRLRLDADTRFYLGGDLLVRLVTAGGPVGPTVRIRAGDGSLVTAVRDGLELEVRTVDGTAPGVCVIR